MEDNNTTNGTGNEEQLVDVCINALNETVACVVETSSSIFDDVEIVLGACAILLGIGVWAYRKYLMLSADGKFSMDEILDVLDEVKEKAEEVKEQVEVLEDTLDKYKVTELRVMLKEKGLSTKGKKSELITRLEE